MRGRMFVSHHYAPSGLRVYWLLTINTGFPFFNQEPKVVYQLLHLVIDGWLQN